MSYNICFIGTMNLKSQRDKFAGILRYARTCGMTVQQIDQSLINRRLCAQLLRRKDFSGFITGEDNVWQKLSDNLKTIRQPIVAMDPCHADFNNALRPTAIVELDSIGIAGEIADRFIRRGFTNFAYVGYANSKWAPIGRVDWRSRLRYKGFSERLQQDGFSCPRFEATGRFDNKERTRLGAWLQKLPKPCAIMAYWDNLARDVANVCHEFNICIPDQIAIIGTDNDILLCEDTNPTLSSLEIDFEGGGYKSAEILHDILQKHLPSVSQITRYGSLAIVERASTQDFKRSAQLVSAACDFIRQNAISGITVQDVARKVGISLRLLQLRFAESRKHTIIDEITAVKLAAVKHLLETTSLPIAEIAELCGYEYGHLFNLFKRKIGIAPGTWRNQHGIVLKGNMNKDNTLHIC